MGENAPVSAIEAIEKAMEGVTPGPWHSRHLEHGSRVNPDIAWCGHTSGKSHAETKANADYIAACSPNHMREVLALARQAEALQRENAELRTVTESGQAFANQVRSITYKLNGQAYSSTVSALNKFDADFRRARALLGGENAGN